MQTLLLVGKPLSSIMTTIVFLGLIYLTTIFTTKNRFFRTINILFIISLFYLVNPNFNDTVMWVTGAGNYLYTIFLVMVFIIPYAKFFDDINYKKDRYFSIIFALYGILVGWTNENTAAALIGSLILILIYIKMKYKSVKLPVWAISGLLGLVLGFCVMIFAPGNGIRSVTALSKYANLIIMILNRLYQMERALTNYLWEITFLILISIVMKKYLKIKFTINQIFFLLLAIISYGVMICSPTMPDRAYFCTLVFGVVFCLNVITELIKSNFKLSVIYLYLGLFLYFCFTMQAATEILLPIFK